MMIWIILFVLVPLQALLSRASIINNIYVDLLARQPLILDSVDHTSDRLEKRDQTPLAFSNGIHSNGNFHSARLEINYWNFLGLPIYTTNIAVGSPNQAFRMLLDLRFGGLMVRSIDCGNDGPGCGYGGFSYNHTASSTYENGHQRFLVHLPAQYAYGNISRDDVHLVSLALSNLTFGEVDDFYGDNIYYSALADVADGSVYCTY